MILKQQEDSKADIDILESFLDHPAADSHVRRRINEEIRNISSGDRGERNAAYEMNVHFGPTRNWVVIHDLRIEYDGMVAQIDHLLVNRLLDFWLCESKRFANGLTINEQGEFHTYYNRIPKGVASPIEQNKKHLKVMRHVIDAGLLNFPTRLGMSIKPKLHSLVLISNGAIRRPAKPIPGIETVIKCEQLHSTIERRGEGGNPFDLAKLVGVDTLEKLGQQIVGLHRPITFDWQRRVGLAELEMAARLKNKKPVISAPARINEVKPATSDSLSCAACSAAISSGVAKFCLANAERFGSQLYCMACQPIVAPRANG